MTSAPRQIPLDLPHRPSLARDDLIVSGSNRMAVQAIDAWPQWRHSVLLVVGPPGSGKTHLAHAWAEMAGATMLDAASATGRPDGADFRVAIDDIDTGGVAEADRFGIVNAARLGGGSVLATARAHPRDMRDISPDLRSRLAAATLVEVGQPDDALLTGVLAKLFSDRQLLVTPRMLAYLAGRMERSLDAARRLVAQVDRETLAQGRKVSPRLLGEILERDQPA